MDADLTLEKAKKMARQQKPSVDRTKKSPITIENQKKSNYPDITVHDRYQSHSALVASANIIRATGALLKVQCATSVTGKAKMLLQNSSSWVQ